ncbi:MAG: hypothetical protein WDO73_21695 [Ignavibacteriota bacterium]
MSQILPIVGIALALCQLADAQAPLRLTLPDALMRAQKYSQQTFNANIEALLAHEDTVQAKAALLPTVNGLSQYIYTQGNGTASGIFVSNDGVHIYNDWATAHADLYAPAKRADLSSRHRRRGGRARPPRSRDPRTHRHRHAGLLRDGRRGTQTAQRRTERRGPPNPFSTSPISRKKAAR